VNKGGALKRFNFLLVACLSFELFLLSLAGSAYARDDMRVWTTQSWASKQLHFQGAGESEALIVESKFGHTISVRYNPKKPSDFTNMYDRYQANKAVSTGLNTMSNETPLEGSTDESLGNGCDVFAVPASDGTLFLFRFVNSARQVVYRWLKLEPGVLTAAPAQVSSRSRVTGDKVTGRVQVVDVNGGPYSFNFSSDLKADLGPATLSKGETKLTLREIQQERQSIFNDLHKDVHGQDFALERFAFHAMEMKINGLSKPKVLIANGSSGAGKTFAARQLAKRLFSSYANFLETNGNEYSSDSGSRDYHRLLPSSATVKDSGNGALVEWLKRVQGRGVWLINEGDKMNPEIWLKLMEFLDEGRISDKDGKPVPCTELLIVITSNRGAKLMFPTDKRVWSQKEVDQRVRSFTQDELIRLYMQKDGMHDRFQLPQEVMNRVSEIVPFGPVTEESAVQIAETAFAERSQYYYEKYAIELKTNPDALEYLAVSEFRSSNDARKIRHLVENTTAELMMSGLDPLQLETNHQITITLGKSQTGQVTLFARAGDLQMELPKVTAEKVTPINDLDLRQVLRDLESNMNNIVIGQEYAIKQISDGVIAHDLKGDATRPVAIFLTGPSGNGKTETGRALAKARYGSSARFAIVPMGNISGIDDFDNLFGSPAKFQGADVIRPFEQALRNNPDGGVLILDEISNMGGKNPAIKASLFMRLYDIFEQGRWVSPIDGREYDLSKYTFVLTGNDGEDLVRGMTDDAMLLATWNRYRDPSQAREILRQAGIPNAFINRMLVTLFLKPMLKSEVPRIVQKLWNENISGFLDANPGLQINMAPGCLERMSQVFFTADQAGRSVRKVMEKEVTATIMKALLYPGVQIPLQKVRIDFDMVDNATSKPYVTQNTPAREVQFMAQLLQNGQEIHTEVLDATPSVAPQILQNVEGAVLVGFHEAGHAVVNDSSVTGEEVSFISLRGGKFGDLTYLGVAMYEKVLNGRTRNPDRNKAVLMIARYWAGRKAQELAGFEPDAGWKEDLKEMRIIAQNYLLKWGLDDDFEALPVNDNGEPQLSDETQGLFRKKMKDLMDDGEKLAEQILKKKWRLVRAIVAELLLKGQISGPRAAEITSYIEGTEKQPSVANKAEWTYGNYVEQGRCERALMSGRR
jgi:ATP-dependent Clp protease ATP-binding subunit ClpA